MSRAVIAELLALQQLDLDIERGVIEADALRRELENDATTRTARAALQKATQTATVRAREVREAESMLEDTQARIQRQETRLYAGGTPPKELSALQQEIAHLNVQRASQEDALLAAMEASEAAQRATEQRREALDAAMRAQGADRAQLATKLAESETRLTDLRARRAAKAAPLPADALARYESLRRTRAGRAIAEVKGGTCQACRVSLTTATLQRVRAGSEFVPCSNCGRILYVP
jgi:uncharacterized protein